MTKQTRIFKTSMWKKCKYILEKWNLKYLMKIKEDELVNCNIINQIPIMKLLISYKMKNNVNKKKMI